MMCGIPSFKSYCIFLEWKTYDLLGDEWGVKAPYWREIIPKSEDSRSSLKIAYGLGAYLKICVSSLSSS